MAFRIAQYLSTPLDERRHQWLFTALQSAVELELFTIPPYLTAMWSVRDENDDVVDLFRTVALQEMMHAGTVCNLLAGLGQRPLICDPNVVPKYPRPLPGDVHPDIPLVPLRRLSDPQIELFMHIEQPDKP